MDRRLLRVPQRAELSRLVDHGGVGGDLLVGVRTQVRGDLGDEDGDVIEKLVGREDLVRLHRQQPLQTFEPAAGEYEALRADAL